jgi:hypothetical protein
MEFLNAAILFGLAAMAIPIAIHIFSRRRFEKINWGAMQFLRTSYAQRSRYILLEELILLLLRVGVLGLLVLALARPLLKNPYFAAGKTGMHQDAAVILDVSSSMSLRQEQQTTFERGLTRTREILGELSRGDSAAVILGSSLPNAIPGRLTFDREELAAALDRSAVSAGSFDAAGSLNLAVELLRKGTNPWKRIFVVTDGQRTGWDLANTRRWEYIAKSAEEGKLSPDVHVYLLPRQSDPITNVVLEHPDLSRPVVGTDRPVSISVRVTNKGATSVPPSAVEFSLDAKPFSTSPIPALSPGSGAFAKSQHHFREPGFHVLNIRWIGQDELPVDNFSTVALKVHEHLNVLIVDGAPSASKLESASAYIQAALQPSGLISPSTADSGELIRTFVKPVVDFKRDDIAGMDVVILANVSGLPKEVGERLKQFVAGGGGLIIAPGSRAEDKRYSELFGPGTERWLPAKMERPSGLDEAKKQTAIGHCQLSHSIFRALQEDQTSDLQEVRVYRWWKLTPPAESEDSNVPARLKSGDPLLVEAPRGRGRVIISAIPFDSDWSDITGKNAFVPLMHEMVHYLTASGIGQWNIEMGQTFYADLPERFAGARGEVILPDGRNEQIYVETDGWKYFIRWGQTAQPGLYVVRFAKEESAGKTEKANKDSALEMYFVVKPDPAESDMAMLSEEEKEKIRTWTRADFHQTEESFDQAVNASRPGQEIWQWLALAVLGILLIEIAMTRRIARRRRFKMTDRISFGQAQ